MFSQTPLPGVPAWMAIVLSALVIAAAIVDLRSGKIPNWLTYPAVGIGLAGHAFHGGVHGTGEYLGLSGSAQGLAMGFIPLLLCVMAGGMGFGDAKLMGAIGAMTGWRLVLVAMLYGFLAAAVMAVYVMVRKRIVRRTLRRVWHMACLVVTPGAKPADPTTADSPTIPFAVGMCVGTAAAMIEVLLFGPGRL